MRTLKEIPVGTKFMFLNDANKFIEPPVYIKMVNQQIFDITFARVVYSDTVDNLLDDQVIMITA
jgi:hypothetical protein